jgi:hypothetical protein
MDCLFTHFYWFNAPISRKVGGSFSIKSFINLIAHHRYASDSTYIENSKTFGAGRVSNATIESFFKILKHSILRQQTNLRAGEFLLKIYSTTKARLKANKHSIQQKGSKKHGRSTKNEVDTTCLAEQWKLKGTRTATRGIYFEKFTEFMLTASDIRNRLKEKLE